MAGFDDNDFSLSGLTQEGHELDVTVISSSSDDDNYGGLLDCAQKLGGELSEKVHWKGACSQVSSQVSSQMLRVSQFLKSLIRCQSLQTPWHLLYHNQTNRFM